TMSDASRKATIGSRLPHQRGLTSRPLSPIYLLLWARFLSSTKRRRLQGTRASVAGGRRQFKVAVGEAKTLDPFGKGGGLVDGALIRKFPASQKSAGRRAA